MNTINESLISTVRSYIQNEKELIPALMSLLNIGKQSVYRRLRNEIPFTFAEASILSSNMGFSIDDIINRKNIDNNIIQNISCNKEIELQDQYIEAMNKVGQMLENARRSKDLSLFLVTSRLPYAYSMVPENIMKIRYFKWYHQRLDVSGNLKFSDFVLPSSITSAAKNLIYNYRNIKKQTLIIDHNILETTIKEIRYFYEGNLISEKDLDLLLSELIQILEEFEMLAIKGYYKSGPKVDIYLSSLDIEYSSLLLEDDEKISFQTYINTEEPLLIFNQKLCYNQKRWMYSLKKYSTLISECNEFTRALFFKKQRDLITNFKRIDNC